MIHSIKHSPRSVRILIIVLLVISVVSLINWVRLSSRLSAIENPQAASSAEIKRLVVAVGKFIVLPADETPSLATVSDPDKLKDQSFFAQAEVGDKVLIYATARKAILWRPSIEKIIEVSALNIGAPQTVVPAKK